MLYVHLLYTYLDILTASVIKKHVHTYIIYMYIKLSTLQWKLKQHIITDTFHRKMMTCLMWTPVLCDYLSYVNTCLMWTPVLCDYLSYVTTCLMWTPVLCDYLSYATTCFMWLPVLCEPISTFPLVFSYRYSVMHVFIPLRQRVGEHINLPRSSVRSSVWI